jgi:two-component system response regulator ChvI
MARIAVVDDEKNIRRVIRIALEKEFHTVEEYGDGLAAWEVFRKERPDLIILDITMPRMDGIEVCKKVRSLSMAPIIFLSSRDEEIDKVLGLESGADDYVCKPFSLRELSARIHAALRRSGGASAPAGGAAAEQINRSAPGGECCSLEVRDSGTCPLLRPQGAPGYVPSPRITRGHLVLDEDRLDVLWKGRALECTVTEFRILRSMVSPPGIIKTREQLMAAAFPEDIYPNDRAADSHIKRIRKKFLDVDGDFQELEAVYGLGYKWRAP